MNFKRKKCKRRVRCTMCTKYRWMGNNNVKGDRLRLRDRRKLQEI